MHITQAYHDDHFNCLDALLQCTEGRTGLSCPDISLMESCKHTELINLTKFLVTTGKKNISEDNGESLRTAAKSGNLSAVEYLINSCDVNVDEPDTQGATALLFACMESHLDIVDALLKSGANVNVCVEETPLTAACRNGQQEIVNRLLKETPNLATTNRYGMTPAEIAVNKGHTALATKLIKKGAALSYKNVSFHSLCQLGDVNQMSSFLQDCTDSLIADEKVLNVVVKADNTKLLDLLLTNDTVIKSKEVLEKVLETASIMGLKTTVRTLIEWDNGSMWRSIQHKPECHLYQSMKHQHVDIVALLLEQGCSLTIDSCPLEDIVKSKDILTLVVEHMPQSLLNEALLVACSSGHRIPESCVQLLLNKSAEAKYQDPQTQITPLIAATITPSETLVRILLEYGADPNPTDDKNNSPLYLACEIDSHSIASQLIYNRNDENDVKHYERVSADPSPSHLPPEKCPLWISCLHGYLDLVELLAENNANLNLRNEKESLLEASHRTGQHEVVRLLLEYGADPETLSTVDLKTCCHYGYAERAVAISHEISMDELKVCISEAYDESFPETGMGIIINIPDEGKQKELFHLLKHQSDSGPQPQPTYDTSDSQSQEENSVWQCFYNRNTEQMKKLIKGGCNPNVTNSNGITLLQTCVSDKRIPTVLELCSLVDINQKDSSGRNILFYVLKYLKGRSEQADLFHLFIEKGADMKATDNFGRTLLHEWDPQLATNSEFDISLQNFIEHIPLNQM